MTDAWLGHLHSVIVNPLGFLCPLDVGVPVFKKAGIGLELLEVRAAAPGVARAAQLL